MIKKSILIYFVLNALFSWNVISGQTKKISANSEQVGNNKLRIFLDCDDCRLDFLINKLSFVDIVREPNQAQVYILVTEEKTASKGKKYSFNFIGKKEFKNSDSKICFMSAQSDTELELQKKFTKILLFGLTNYSTGNDLIENYEIIYNARNKINGATQIKDPWNSWVFSIKLNGGFEAEENDISVDLKSKITIEKITEKWKFLNKYSYETEQEKFINNKSSIVSKLFKKEFNSKIVYSISEHFSAGLLGEVKSSTYHNIDLSLGLSSAIEYNFLPWQLSATKYVTLGYYTGFFNYKYNEETIYNKTGELLFEHSAILAARFMQEWGGFKSELEFSQFPSLSAMYSIKFDSNLSLRVFEGFSVELDLTAESIHNQIYLAKGDASLEEILLKRTQLETAYNVQISAGLKYTFGSIFNNIVNDRL